MQVRLSLSDGEYWWGGSSAMGDAFPLHKGCTFRKARTYTGGNQDMPFFLSTKGRYVFADSPMDVTLEGGVFTFTADGDIHVCDGHGDLRGAYVAAQKKHFPVRGDRPEEDFFRVAQFNSWIEFQYLPSQEKILSFAREILAHGFEPGIFMIDEGWAGRYGDWSFEPSRFPDPRAMVDELHRMGFRVMLWIVPLVCPDGKFFIDAMARPDRRICMRQENGEIAITKWWNGYSALLDFTNPDDCAFLKEQLDRLITEYGIDGFKFDGGNADMYDPKNFITAPPVTTQSMFALNIAYNRFAMQYRYHELKDSYGCGGMRQIQRLRDKFHRYTDEGLASLLPDAFIAGLTGHPYLCPDMIGGGDYSSFLPGMPIDGELFVRWAQASVFFPMIQYSKRPWACLDGEHCRLVLEAGRLHNRQREVILREVNRCMESGEPIVRPLCYSYPHEGLEAIKDAFLFGEHILVAPVLTDKTYERTVHLPRGRWRGADGTLYKGGQSYTVKAPLDTLPYFERVDETPLDAAR